MLLGSHVSMSGKEMMLLSAKEAASYKANTMMVYTGAPQNTRRKPIEELMISQGQAFMQANGIEEVVVHAPYIINLANTTKEGYLDFAIEFLREEIRRAEAIGAKQVVLHPGSHVGAGVDVGIAQFVHDDNDSVDDVFHFYLNGDDFLHDDVYVLHHDDGSNFVSFVLLHDGDSILFLGFLYADNIRVRDHVA